MNELIKKVEQWFIDRNLHTGDPLKQWEKLVEEFGELVKGKNKNDIEMIKDSIGDMSVVLIGIVMQKGHKIDSDILSGEGEYVSTLDVLTTIKNLREGLDGTNVNSYKTDDYHMYTDFIYELFWQLDDLSNQYDTGLEDCLSLAYNEIKNRKGKLIDGVFVKEEDL